MSDNAIVVENLSKSYLLGHKYRADGRHKYTALRDIIGREVRNFGRKAADLIRGVRLYRAMKLRSFGRSGISILKSSRGRSLESSAAMVRARARF